MNNYQVSWIDNEGEELYSGWIDYETAITLFSEICEETVDYNQVEARLYTANDVLLKRFDNIENKLYTM